MIELSGEQLLLVAPHIGFFIKDQLALIKRHFERVHVLLPIPMFSKIVSKLPYLHERFTYLKVALNSAYSTQYENIRVFPIKFLTLPVRSISKRNFHLVSRSCLRFLSRGSLGFSLIHTHFLGAHSYVGATIKERYGKPLIITAHGGDIYSDPFGDEWYCALAKFALNKADGVITVSKYNARKLLQLGVPSRKVWVVPNGYDKELFTPIPSHQARKELGLPVGKKVILTVGNLVEAKGHAYLLNAMQTVLRKQGNVILVIAGSGPLQRRLQRHAKDLGLSDNVLFAGMKIHEEIPVLMSACDLFVLPSISEGFPTVIPEAMACGKPVVATNVGGVPEIITKQDVGILVSPRNTEELSSAILGALNRKWNSEKIQVQASQYSWNSLVPKIISVYRDVLSHQ